MKAVQKIEVALDVREVEKILAEYLLKRHPGYKVEAIKFDIQRVGDTDYDYSDLVLKGVESVLVKVKVNKGCVEEE